MFLDFACAAIGLATAGSGSGAVIRPQSSALLGTVRAVGVGFSQLGKPRLERGRLLGVAGWRRSMPCLNSPTTGTAALARIGYDISVREGGGHTSRNRIYLIESGDANPTLDTLGRLAAMLDVAVEIRPTGFVAR